MRRYQRIKMEEREEISRWLACQASMREIALLLGRSPSSISREIWKGFGKKGR